MKKSKKTALELLYNETVEYFTKTIPGYSDINAIKAADKVYMLYLKGMLNYTEAIKNMAYIFTEWERSV